MRPPGSSARRTDLSSPPPEDLGMDALRISRKFKVLHRVFRPSPPVPVEDHSPRTRTLTAQALWLGLVSGWIELGVIVGHRAFVGTVTRVSVWFNDYHRPLGLLAHLA